MGSDCIVDDASEFGGSEGPRPDFTASPVVIQALKLAKASADSNFDSDYLVQITLTLALHCALFHYLIPFLSKLQVQNLL